MKKSIFFYLLPVLLIVLCLGSCNETAPKTEYTHVIPANATEVAALNIKSIINKAGLNHSDNQAALQKLLGLLLESKNTNLKSRRKWNRLERSGLPIRGSYPAQHSNHLKDYRSGKV